MSQSYRLEIIRKASEGDFVPSEIFRGCTSKHSNGCQMGHILLVLVWERNHPDRESVDPDRSLPWTFERGTSNGTSKVFSCHYRTITGSDHSSTARAARAGDEV